MRDAFAVRRRRFGRTQQLVDNWMQRNPRVAWLLCVASLAGVAAFAVSRLVRLNGQMTGDVFVISVGIGLAVLAAGGWLHWIGRRLLPLPVYVTLSLVHFLVMTVGVPSRRLPHSYLGPRFLQVIGDTALAATAACVATLLIRTTPKALRRRPTATDAFGLGGFADGRRRRRVTRHGIGDE